MKSRQDAVETARTLSATLGFADLSRVVLGIIRAELGVDRGTVFVVDRENDEIRSTVADRMRIGEITLPIGSGIAGTVAATNEVIDIADAYADDRFDAKFDPILNYETRDIFCSPIQDQTGAVVGVLQLLNRSHPFTSEDKQFLSDLSRQLAAGLQRMKEGGRG